MTANKVKHEFRTISNFNSEALTKNKVYKILRETKVPSRECTETTKTCIDNQIDLGTYIIRLEFNHSRIEAINPDRLKDYGRFNIRIYENCQGELSEINLRKEPLFKGRDWVNRNLTRSFRISDLVEAIWFCRRLHQLRAFN